MSLDYKPIPTVFNKKDILLTVMNMLTNFKAED